MSNYLNLQQFGPRSAPAGRGPFPEPHPQSSETRARPQCSPQGALAGSACGTSVQPSYTQHGPLP